MRSYRTETKWAMLFMLMTLGWMVLERAAGLHDKYISRHAIFTNFIAIPAILLYVLALREKRQRDYGGSITYRQAFMSGLIVTLIITVFSPATQYITSTWITPHFFDNMISYAVREGKSTQPEAEAYFNLKSYIQQGLIGAPVMGLITTAIVAFFVSRKKKAG